MERSQQGEAKSNLKGLYTAERAYKGEHDAFEADLTRVGWRPERGNRYAYFLTESGPVLHQSQPPPDGKPAPYSIVTQDVAKYGGEEWLRPADTGCAVTPGKDDAGGVHQLGLTARGFVALAARKDRGDARFDCWSIASMERTSATGERIAAGEPHHELER